MAKDIKLKSGSKKRHNSLYRVVLKTEDEAWNDNFSEFVTLQKSLMSGSRDEVESLIEEQINWLDKILASENISESFVLDENAANSVKPFVLGALSAKSGLTSISQLTGLAFNNSSRTDEVWQYMFISLLKLIPKLMIVQEAVHETAILGHKAATKGIKNKAKDDSNAKDENIEKCRSEYQRIKKIRPDFSDSDIARKLKPWLLENHKIDRSESTIRKWIRQLQKS